MAAANTLVPPGGRAIVVPRVRLGWFFLPGPSSLLSKSLNLGSGRALA